MTTRRSIALAASALVLLAGSTALASPQETTTVVDHGHVDLMAGVVVNGALAIRFKDGTVDPPVLRDPETVVTHIKPEARIEVPDAPEYAFLGPAGSHVWISPELEDTNLVWAGWNTEELTADRVAADSVRWTLDAVGGDEPGSAAPGAVTVYQSGPFGEPLPRVFDTAHALPQQHPLELGIHAHANWTFSAEGVYRLTFSLEATTPTGRPLRDTVTYAIAVGEVDPKTVTPGAGEPTSTTTAVSTTTTPVETTTTTPTQCAVLNDGHVDLIAPALLDGALRTRVKDGTAGPDKAVWREPADTVVHLVPKARNTIPTAPAYAFLGEPGRPVWLIPQTQIPGIVWAGWNTESLRPRDVQGDVTITLSGVDGPGRVAVFLTGLTPTVLIDSGDGLPDALTVAPGTHAHANWAFSAEGVYRLTIEVAATLTSGERAVDTDEFTVAVGDVDPTAALGRNCAPPTETTTTPASLTTTPPARPTMRLANTGNGPVGPVIALGALLVTGGTALLLLARTRRRHG